MSFKAICKNHFLLEVPFATHTNHFLLEAPFATHTNHFLLEVPFATHTNHFLLEAPFATHTNHFLLEAPFATHARGAPHNACAHPSPFPQLWTGTALRSPGPVDQASQGGHHLSASHTLQWLPHPAPPYLPHPPGGPTFRAILARSHSRMYCLHQANTHHCKLPPTNTLGITFTHLAASGRPLICCRTKKSPSESA